MSIVLLVTRDFDGTDVGIGHGGPGLSAVEQLNLIAEEANNSAKTVHALAVLGAWAVDGDGVNTNGAGMVGNDPVSTEAAAAFALVYDESATEYQQLVTSDSGAGYTAAYQLLPDVSALDDAVYFGDPLPFCELGFDVDTVASWVAGVVVWEYWDGSAWSTLTIAWDGTGTTGDGTDPFVQDGAISFVPPTDWVASAEGDATSGIQLAYWIRMRVTTGLTTEPTLNATEHDVITPEDGWTAPCDGTITGIRLVDGAGTLHTTADVKFILMNYTTGAHSGELTFAQDKRTDSWTVSLAIADGDKLGVVCTQEDGAAEPSGVMLELEIASALAA